MNKRAWQTVALGGGVITNFFYDIPPSVRILIVLIGADIFTGVVYSIMQKKLSSRVSFQGVTRKIFMLGVVALLAFFDAELPPEVLKEIGLPFLDEVSLMTAGATYYVVTETISVFENLVLIGVPLPDFVKRILPPDKKNRVNQYDKNSWPVE